MNRSQNPIVPRLSLFLVLLALLAACGGPDLQPTATPASAATAPAQLPTPAAAAATPSPSAGAPAPPDQTPTSAASPEAGAARPLQRARLGTFFFYWYNCPQQECDATQLSVLPPGWLAPLASDGDERDGRAYSSFNYDWFEGELRDMASAGVDVVFPVSWGDHPHHWFRQDRLDLLVQANGTLPQPLAIGMFLDSTAQQAMYNDFVADGYRFGPNVPPMPLSDPRSGYFFYERHIKGFFERIPREMWATEAGRPMIVVYTAVCCSDLQLSGALWGAVKQAFARDFGVEPWLILEDTWFNPAALAPPAGKRSVEQVADGRYSWGTALNGPSTRELHGYRVSSAGPGFDNSRITNIVDPRVQPRDVPPGGGSPADGAFFRASLAAVPDDADLVLIETWNEWPESSAIARASWRGEDGQLLPDSFYIDILRRWRLGQ